MRISRARSDAGRATVHGSQDLRSLYRRPPRRNPGDPRAPQAGTARRRPRNPDEPRLGLRVDHLAHLLELGTAVPSIGAPPAEAPVHATVPVAPVADLCPAVSVEGEGRPAGAPRLLGHKNPPVIWIQGHGPRSPQGSIGKNQAMVHGFSPRPSRPSGDPSTRPSPARPGSHRNAGSRSVRQSKAPVDRPWHLCPAGASTGPS